MSYKMQRGGGRGRRTANTKGERGGGGREVIYSKPQNLKTQQILGLVKSSHMYCTLKTKTMYSFVAVSLPPHPLQVSLFWWWWRVSGWAVLGWCEKQEVTARPKETHLQPEIPPTSPTAPLPLPSLITKIKSATLFFS